MLNRTITTDGRGARLAKSLPKRIRGFGLAIDHLDGWPHDARLLDHSPVLSIEKALMSGDEQDGHRRFGFVEYAGEGIPPRVGLVRSVGDVFCADSRVAAFLWQAALEKIERDAADGAGA